MGFKNLLSKDETIKLIKDFRNGDRDALNVLVECNMGLIIDTAKQYAGKGVELEDLIQEGSIGFQKAVEKFDINSKNALSTVARPWILKYVIKAVQDWSLVKFSDKFKEKQSIIYNARQRYYKEFDEEPSNSELSVYLNGRFSEDEIEECDYAHYINNIEYIDREIDEDCTLSDIIPSNDISLYEDISKDEKCKWVYEILDKVSDEEAQALVDVYGIKEYKTSFSFGSDITFEDEAKIAANAIAKIQGMKLQNRSAWIS